VGSLIGLRIVNRYDVEGIDKELFDRCGPVVFSEPQVDVAMPELPIEGVRLDEQGFAATVPAEFEITPFSLTGFKPR
jgi:phosphoribosylformylglycinamidine synthase